MNFAKHAPNTGPQYTDIVGTGVDPGPQEGGSEVNNRAWSMQILATSTLMKPRPRDCHEWDERPENPMEVDFFTLQTGF